MTYSRPSTSGSDYSNQPERQLQLVVHAGPLAGKGFPLTKEIITFGRDPENDISWDDSQVSRRHAQLTRQGDQLILEDLGSTNGTLVNGRPIEGEHVLQPADIISIGTSIFGVKGFSAPNTLGVTQLSRQPPPSASTAPPVTMAPRPATPPSKPRPTPRAAPSAARSGPGKLSMLAIGGILALIIIVLSLAIITAYLFFQGESSPVTQAPVVVITAPANGVTTPLNLPVTVQATASDPSGVTRMELWVNGAKAAEAVSPAQQGQPTLTASLQWVPTVPGSHLLEVRAYNIQGAVSQATAVTVNVSGSEEGTSTLTPTPGTPTPTVPTQPSLTTLTDLNVRSGPDTTAYEVIGLLPSGTAVEIIGRDEARQWWQIRFDPAPNDVGWVASDTNFSRAVNVENIPVAVPPPTPTGTPTPTPTPSPTSTSIPPTQTATATSVPPTETATATPTLTPTPRGTTVEFKASQTVIQGGQCITLSWNVVEVREVYYQGEGVAGVGNRTECPPRTTTYNLRVIKMDGSEQAENITVEVINPVASAGNIIIDPGETIDVDVDDGEIPGDDFRWVSEGNERRFEVQEGVQLSPKGQLSSLEELTLAECAGSAYGTYTYIDASDVIADPINSLVNGRAACYRTSEGRLGKIRFPDYSTGSLRLEWVTWR